MATKDPRIDAYIAKAAPFAQPILKHIRKIVHVGCPEVEETMKWSMPHFDYKGPMCGMAAFTKHASFGFWKESLVLGANASEKGEGMGSFGCISSLADLPPEKTLIAHVRKAVALNDAGIKSSTRSSPQGPATEMKLPNYFAEALKRNKKAQANFRNFSTSKRNEYVVWVTEAKRDATREQRLETSLEWIAEGKSRNWKYQPK